MRYAESMNKSVQKLGTALRNPTVQRILAWGLPVLFGWILSKLDKKPRKKG